MSARYRTERESDDTSAWRVAAFNRPGLEAAWQRASFTSMVGGRQVHADEPAEADLGLQTAPAQGAVAAVVAPQLSKGEGDDRLPLAAMWGGTVVGTWVHAVFEHLSFQSDDAGALCERGQAGRPARRDVTNLVADLGQRCGHRREADRVLLLDALPHILATPLDAAPLQAGAQALPAGLCLADLSDAQRMDELDFDLSLMGGERWQPGQTLDPAAVANALRPRLAEQDWDGHTWLQALMERADDPSSDWSLLPRIAGILTGQIDLVFEAGGRLYLADYKTNRIHGADVRDCRAVHYSRPWLAWAMAGHGYHLQALLYTVALHRLLGERMGADYDYDRHLGGHLYLFVRGMTGARARLPHGAVQGVYADRWPHQVVEALDAALDPTLTPGHGRAP
jgi:exodeoxyribonuclease V beta subunit